MPALYQLHQSAKRVFYYALAKRGRDAVYVLAQINPHIAHEAIGRIGRADAVYGKNASLDSRFRRYGIRHDDEKRFRYRAGYADDMQFKRGNWNV